MTGLYVAANDRLPIRSWADDAARVLAGVGLLVAALACVVAIVILVIPAEFVGTGLRRLWTRLVG